MDVTEWLAPFQAAKLLGCTSQTIVKFCKDGRLIHIWTPMGRLIDPKSVEALRREREAAVAAR